MSTKKNPSKKSKSNKSSKGAKRGKASKPDISSNELGDQDMATRLANANKARPKTDVEDAEGELEELLETAGAEALEDNEEGAVDTAGADDGDTSAGASDDAEGDDGDEVDAAAQASSPASDDPASKLLAAGEKAARQATERQNRTVRGAHLTNDIMKLFEGKAYEDRSGFHRYTGKNKKRVAYLAKKGGRVDVSGFELAHHAIIPITKEQAADRHLGRVRGQVNFEKGDEDIMSAIAAIAAALDVEDPETAKASADAKAAGETT